MMKYFIIAVVLIIMVNVQALPLMEKQVQLRQSKDDLRTVFIAILQQTGIPVLYEGCPRKITPVDIPITNGTVEEILNALSGSKYRWSMKNGVLLFQNKKIVEEPYYPIKRYRFNLSIDTDDLQKFLKKNTFFDDLWKERISNWGMMPDYKTTRKFQKTYKKASLRNILLDLLKDSNSFGLIYKYSPQNTNDENSSIKRNKKFDYNLIKDAGKPIYGLICRSYSIFPPDRFIPEQVLDGYKLLKCSFKFSYSDDKKAQITVNLKNNSSKPLNFKDFRKEGLVIYDAAYKSDQMLSIIGEFLLYPSLKSEIPENFTLKPSEVKSFTFPLKGARYMKAKGNIISPGTESKYSYKPYKTKKLNSPHEFSFLKLIIYFYDSKGDKYKAISQEMIITYNYPKPK